METNVGVNNMGVLDIFFISVFLVANIVLGFVSRRKCWDAKEAVFGKTSKLSDVVLMISMVATMVSATMLINDVQQIYVKGLPVLISFAFMMPAMYFLVTFFLVPRIVVTRMAFSWNEYIGEIYGTLLRVFFALCNLLLYVGFIAELFLCIKITISMIFNCPDFISNIVTVISALILILYTSFGCFRVVTITDILQFFIFFVIVVFLALFYWIKTPEEVHLNFFNLFNGSNPKMCWDTCFGSIKTTITTLSFWFVAIIPDFSQTLYQRCYAGRSLKSAKKNMLAASVIFFIFSLIIDFLALQILASDNTLTENTVLPYLVDKLSFPGLKGLFCVATLSLAISTIDSLLNASAVVLVNDVYSPLKSVDITPLIIKRPTFLVGILALIISLYASSIFDIFMSISEFLLPTSVIPALAIMLGFKTNKNVIYTAICAGLITIISWHVYGNNSYGSFLGILANSLTLLFAHLIWKKWFKSNDPRMYYNQKDNFKRLKDFEYDDDFLSYVGYKIDSGNWKEDLEKAFQRSKEEKKRREEEEKSMRLKKRFHEVVEKKMKMVVDEYDKEEAEREAYNRSVREKKAKEIDFSLFKERDPEKDFYELKDLDPHCAAYEMVKKAGHKLNRKEIMLQYSSDLWVWKRDHHDDPKGPHGIYDEKIYITERIFGIKQRPAKVEEEKDVAAKIGMKNFIDLRDRFKKAVKAKMDELGLEYIPDMKDELDMLTKEQEDEKKVLEKYRKLWMEELQEEIKKKK